MNKGMQRQRGDFLQSKAEEGGILAVFRPNAELRKIDC